MIKIEQILALRSRSDTLRRLRLGATPALDLRGPVRAVPRARKCLIAQKPPFLPQCSCSSACVLSP
jgi:hypothetical protein